MIDDVVGLCIACAHHKPLGLWRRERGQTPPEPEGLCFECRDLALPARGPCDSEMCLCASKRKENLAEDPTRVSIEEKP